jgi:phosphate starvation-inducible protein PhoH
VVRHRLVGEIVDAYEKWDAAQPPAQAQSQGSRHSKQHR